MTFIEENSEETDQEEGKGSEPHARSMTRRMRQAAHEDLAGGYIPRNGETGGCEQDELADYFRSDGQDPLE